MTLRDRLISKSRADSAALRARLIRAADERRAAEVARCR